MLEKCCVDRLTTHSVQSVLNEESAKNSKEIARRRFLEERITKVQLLREFAILNDKKWPKQIITVKFLDGDTYFKSVVKRVSKIWENYANMHFEYVMDFNDADIRISFLQPGAWSFLGVDASTIDSDKPTMNFGWFDLSTQMPIVEGTILHEFGHAIGLIHEHQSPAAIINWNKKFIYRELGGAPNYWTKDEIDINLFQKYNGDITNSVFDPHSIMIYPIPSTWTTDGFCINATTELSQTDIDYITMVYT